VIILRSFYYFYSRFGLSRNLESIYSDRRNEPGEVDPELIGFCDVMSKTIPHARTDSGNLHQLQQNSSLE
jgi:hypothetical protein